jgi:hypothetical protein
VACRMGNHIIKLKKQETVLELHTQHGAGPGPAGPHKDIDSTWLKEQQSSMQRAVPTEATSSHICSKHQGVPARLELCQDPVALFLGLVSVQR